MFTRHVRKSLARYVDNELPAGDRARVEAHVAVCADCRRTLDQIQLSASLVRGLKRVTAPPSVWASIEQGLTDRPLRRPWLSLPTVQWIGACALVLIAAGSAYLWPRPPAERPWEVSPAGGGSTVHMSAGEWIDTRDNSQKRILVRGYGTVDVAPGSRVRLGAVSPSEHRLMLAHGTITAEINAPPRLFIVDTPASTVVDLGCAYTVSVGADGTGTLRMTSGWAALEFKGRESLVPAGALCRTAPGAGPGTPYFDDASAALKRAVDDFDRSRNGPATLETILSEARIRDTLTLWHLLSRVNNVDRGRVYDRMAAFVPPPSPYTREQLLALNADALRAWREELAWKW